MERKLYIINNGLKDLRGHYFETSVSIAEAGRSVGLLPVLAAHVTCPRDIVPDGLEFHAAFTTDHWMIAASAALSPTPRPAGPSWPIVAANSIEALRSGVRSDFDDYLAGALPLGARPG